MLASVISPAAMRPGTSARGTHSIASLSKASTGSPMCSALLDQNTTWRLSDRPGFGTRLSRGVSGPGPQPVSSSASRAAASVSDSPSSTPPNGSSQPYWPVMKRCRQSQYGSAHSSGMVSTPSIRSTISLSPAAFPYAHMFERSCRKRSNSRPRTERSRPRCCVSASSTGFRPRGCSKFWA